MKKLLLFFTAITFGLSLSSCLDGGSQSFSDPAQIVYIDQAQNYIQTYGKTFYGRGLIFSDKMLLMQPKNFYAFSFSWNEESAYTEIDGVNAFNVVITSEEKKIPKTSLNSIPATLEDIGSKFTEISVSLNDETGLYIDDMWLLSYSFKGKEGENAYVELFTREPSPESPDIIDIDVRLTITGEGSGDEKTITNFIGADMSYLRQAFIHSDNEIRIRLNYFKADMNDPVSLDKNQNEQPLKMKSKPSQLN